MNIEIKNELDAQDRLFEALSDLAVVDGVFENIDTLGIEKELHNGLVRALDSVEQRIKKVMEFMAAP